MTTTPAVAPLSAAHAENDFRNLLNSLSGDAYEAAEKAFELGKTAAQAPQAVVGAELTNEALLRIAQEQDYGDEDPKCVLRLLRAAIAADRAQQAGAAAAVPAELKDHNVRQLVDDLTAIGKQFGGTQQLRSRVSGAVTQFLAAQFGWKVATDRAAQPVEQPADDARDAQTQAARDVLAERRRQVEQEGWTPEHDDAYTKQELRAAALCYMRAETITKPGVVPGSWPWPRAWWKPVYDRRNLVKAGALILAEIERVDRQASKGATDGAVGGAE